MRASGRTIFCAGVLLFAAAISLSIMVGGGSVMALVNGPSMFIVVVGGLSLTLAAVGWGGFAAVLRSFFVREPRKAEVALAIVTLRLGAAFVLASGAIGMVLGLIAMLSNMDDPSMIGPGAAVALLSMLHAAIISAVAVAASFALMGHAESSQVCAASTTAANRAVGIAAACAIVGVAVSLLVMLMIQVVMA